MGAPQALELGVPGMRRVADAVWLGRLTANVWIHTTTHALDGVGYYPANGAIVVGGREAILIDTGWNAAQATTILDACAPSDRVLCGGCLVKSTTVDDLGYIVAPRHVVPGHATIAGDPIAHTTHLADIANAKEHRC